MPSYYKWRAAYRAAFMLSLVALALSFTACAKGFKLKDKEEMKKEALAAVSPVAAATVTPTTPNEFHALLSLAAQKSEEVAAIVADPANQGRIQVDGKIGFAFTDLVRNQSSSAETSVLYFELVVKAGTKSAGVLLVSDSATLSLVAPDSSNIRISGYWTINRPDGMPAYIGIDSHVKAIGTNLILEGALYGNFDGSDDAAQLSTVNVPLCTVAADTSWIKELYGEYVDTDNCTILTY